MLRILYVGPLWPGSTSMHRFSTFIDLGHEVTGIDSEPTTLRLKAGNLLHRIRARCLRSGWVPGFRRFADYAQINRQLLQRTQNADYDILWINKGLTVTAATLWQVKRLLPNCRIVGYLSDDFLNPGNQSPQFLEHLPLYDIFFTTKTFNVPELKALGCKHPVSIRNSFEPKVHTPRFVSRDDRLRLGGIIGFIGAFEKARAKSLDFLAASGLSVRVWGNGWQKMKHAHPNLRLEGRGLWDEDYARALCAFDICLGFLCKANRDLQTRRSVEIPACGAFMLAERTTEHQELFQEGLEAEFFASDAELVEKTRFYIENPEARRRIAATGRLRCFTSGYSNPEQMSWALAQALRI